MIFQQVGSWKYFIELKLNIEWLFKSHANNIFVIESEEKPLLVGNNKKNIMPFPEEYPVQLIFQMYGVGYDDRKEIQNVNQIFLRKSSLNINIFVELSWISAVMYYTWWNTGFTRDIPRVESQISHCTWQWQPFPSFREKYSGNIDFILRIRVMMKENYLKCLKFSNLLEKSRLLWSTLFAPSRIGTALPSCDVKPPTNTLCFVSCEWVKIFKY